MQINWKLRLKNKVTLTAIVLGVVGIAYKILAMLGIVPPISENDMVEVVLLVIELLVLLGVFVDPTTAGVGDSQQAMSYDKPRE
jgi:phi LC3 family holin